MPLGSVADPDPAFHSDADPDPTFQTDADPDPTFHFDAGPNLGPAFHFEADPDQAFHFDPDPDPAFHFDTGSDPAIQNDPDPQHCPDDLLTKHILVSLPECRLCSTDKDGPTYDREDSLKGEAGGLQGILQNTRTQRL